MPMRRFFIVSAFCCAIARPRRSQKKIRVRWHRGGREEEQRLACTFGRGVCHDGRCGGRLRVSGAHAYLYGRLHFHAHALPRSRDWSARALCPARRPPCITRPRRTCCDSLSLHRGDAHAHIQCHQGAGRLWSSPPQARLCLGPSRLLTPHGVSVLDRTAGRSSQRPLSELLSHRSREQCKRSLCHIPRLRRCGPKRMRMMMRRRSTMSL